MPPKDGVPGSVCQQRLAGLEVRKSCVISTDGEKSADVLRGRKAGGAVRGSLRRTPLNRHLSQLLQAERVENFHGAARQARAPGRIKSHLPNWMPTSAAARSV